MTQRQQPGRLKSLLLLAIAIVLLLSLLAPQVAGHLPLSFLCLILIPLFLFAALETSPSSPIPVAPRASCAASQAARPALFQIPPPPASA